MKQLGVGVIALGWMGRLHSRGLRQVAERYPELGVAARLVSCSTASRTSVFSENITVPPARTIRSAI